MTRVYLLFLFLIVALPLVGQNQLDDQGLKTGPWKVEYPNGRTLYEATFVAGKPVGEMIRYYDNGGVRARMMFDTTLDRSYTHLYYTGGKEAAEGWYVEQKKDSVWTYYSQFDGSVRIREPYEKGKLQGIVTLYYTGGAVSEKLAWEDHKKQGAWTQYYNTGHVRLRSHYADDLLSGSYEIFYSDGTPKVTGAYVQNKSNGIWTFYGESGEEVYALEYLSGIPVDQEKYNQWIQDSLSNYEIIVEPESIQQY
jgi:antitoxin component YwqK of YwqJK toxin-antitoxin module